MLFITLFTLLSAYCVIVDAFLLQPITPRNGGSHSSNINNANNNLYRISIATRSNKNDSNDENQNQAGQYLDKASKLRKEAEELEAIMRTKRKEEGEKDTSQVVVVKTPPKIYTQLENSDWTISYRFASDPIASNDNDTNQGNEDDMTKMKMRAVETTADTPLVYYSGKVSVRFTGDGYTELLTPTTDDTTTTSKSLTFLKFWGWDKEISNEDEKEYLSFSADIVLPKSDPNYSVSSSSCRFYFNSQVETDSKSGEISLTSGTVTVKRDIEPPGGFWGVFSAGGILAQFRFCGEFLIKPM